MNECIPSLTAIVSQFRALQRDLGEHCELEVRMGTLSQTNRAFSATLHPLTFNDICSSLELCTEWTATAAWIETIDVFFHDATPGSGTLPMATRRTFRTSISGNTVRHVEKTRLVSQFLRCQSVRAALSSECGLDLRVAVSTEVPVDVSTLPTFTDTTLVRIKQRKSYTFRHWRFDVTRVWQGPTRLAADDAQKNSAPNYEVELELINAAPYLAAHTDEYIAKSLCMKLWDLLGRVSRDQSLTYVPVIGNAGG